MKKTFAKIWLALMGTVVLAGLSYMAYNAPVLVAILAVSTGAVAILFLTLWAIDTVVK
jgi:hypothetical protein